MNYEVVHRTVYEYSDPVTVSHHSARVKPRITNTQDRDFFTIEIAPEPGLRKMRSDYFGNQVCFFSIQELHQRLEVVATSRVSVVASGHPALALSPPWEKVRQIFSDPVSPRVVEPYEFVFDSPLVRSGPDLADYARPSFGPGTPLLVGAHDLNRRIFQDCKYD